MFRLGWPALESVRRPYRPRHLRAGADNRILPIAILLTLCAIPAAPAEEPLAELQRLQTAFQEVADRVAPTVVGIRAHRRLTGEGFGTGQVVLVNGSGTVIDADGLILTNEHVVQRTHDLQVVFHDGSQLPGTVVAADTRNDLAIVRVNRTGLTAARFCSWPDVARGQWAVVVGNPFGLGSDGNLSVSVGVISNLGRSLPGLGESDNRLYNDMIQTTAEINPGNSGGPLFSLEGELLGVVTAMHTRSGGDAGAGFAIPMNPTRVRAIARLKTSRPALAGQRQTTGRGFARDPRNMARPTQQVDKLVDE